MRPRRSHQKSRRGCVNCKSRRVKCDEGGPSCERCKTRGLTCEYDLPNPSSSSKVSLPTDGRAEPVRASKKSSGFDRGLAFPAHHRLLELQLMHRWSTVTYKSCCTPGSDDDEVWQFMVPELAVQYDFLLNGLFALSAFDVARLSKEHDHEQYVNAAFEYHNLALGSFQSQLPVIRPESHEAALCFSLMLMVFTLASAQFASSSSRGEDGGMVQTAITHFQLVRGCVPIAESKKGYLAENPYIRKLKSFEDLPRTALDPCTEEAITKLSDLNDSRITSSVLESNERRVQQVVYWEACKKALAHLRQCFERCVDRESQGYALGWLNMAGEEYVEAIKKDDNIALLMLMYWGVLVDRIGHQVWWAQHFGSLLVHEISNRVRDKDSNEATKDITLWAQNLIQSAAYDRAETRDDVITGRST